MVRWSAHGVFDDGGGRDSIRVTDRNVIRDVDAFTTFPANTPLRLRAREQV